MCVCMVYYIMKTKSDYDPSELGVTGRSWQREPLLIPSFIQMS